MKHIKKITFYSIVIFATQLCNYSYTVGENAGKKAAKILGNDLEGAAQTLANAGPNFALNAANVAANAAPNLALNAGLNAANVAANAAPNFALNAANVAANAAPNLALNAGLNAANVAAEAAPKLGLEAVERLDGVLEKHMPAIKEALERTGAAAGAGTLTLIGAGLTKAGVTIGAGATKAVVVVKATTAVIIAAPATPYIAATAVVAAGGWATYRYYNPTPEQMILNAKAQTKVVEAQNDLVKKQQEQQALARKKQMVAGRDLMKQQLNSCFMKNQIAARNSIGIPIACQEAMFAYAATSSSAQSDKAIKTFTQSFPAPKTNSWWPFKKD